MHLSNLVPSKATPLTPKELWSGRKPRFQHLRIWGCPAYVRKRNAGKLETRSKVCLFVGYPKWTKGSLIYNPNEQKVFVSTNVIYLEEDYMMNHKPWSQIVLEEMAGTQSTPVSRTISIDNILAPEVVPDISVSNPVQTLEPRRSGRTVRQPDKFMFLGEIYKAIQEK